MGIFLNGLLGPKISPLPSYRPPCFIKYRPFPTVSNPLPLVGPRYNPFPSVSITQTIPPFLRYNPFSISLCTPVLASLDKGQLLMWIKQFLLGMESIRLTTVKILFLFSCCGLIAFFTFLLSCLSFLHMPCRFENVRRIVIDSETRN